MKNKLFLYKFKSFLLIILVLLTTISFFPYRTSAASIKYKVADAAVDKLVDEAIYSVAKQTGYKIATQEQIDSMRASFKKQFPDWDFTTASDINYDDYPSIAKYDRESKEVIIKLDSDMRSWINNVINQFKVDDTSPKEVSSISIGGIYTKPTICDHYRVGRMLSSGPNMAGGDVYYDKYYEPTVVSDGKTNILYFNFYDDSFNLTRSVKIQNYDDDTVPCEPAVLFYTLNNTEIDVVKFIQYPSSSSSEPYKDYLPYPTKGSELTDTTKLPTELHVPATTDSDNVITPNVSPLPFPSVTDTPDSDGKVKVGDSTIVYQKPTVDPSTGTIVDPVTTPHTEPVPTDDTTGQTPDNTNYNVPTTTPKLDFTPLMSATMKFPFCIPWDLWDTYKIFESGSQVFRYEFKQVDVNFGFIGCGSVTVLPNFVLDFSDYPQIDTAVKVLKFIELMLFIVFLILKTRNLIRG